MERTARSVLVASLIAFALGCKRTPTESSAPPPAPAAHQADIRADHDAGAIPPALAALDPPAPAGDFRDAAEYLPRGEIAGWRQSGPVTRSVAADLFQIIDGAAASYVPYGLRDYAKTDYRRPGTTLVATVELYRFDAPLGAFGRYSLMLSDGRDPSSLQSQAVQHGGGGYQGSTQLAFWKGRVLATISVSDTSDEPNEAQVTAAAREALPLFATALEHEIPEAGPLPPSPLPSEGLVWGGTTYLADAVLGVDQSGPAWVGHYRTADGKRYRLAVFTRANATDATNVISRLRTAGASAIASLADDAFAATTETSGELVVARRGSTVLAIADPGVPNLPTLTRAEKIAAMRTALASAGAVAPDAGARH